MNLVVYTYLGFLFGIELQSSYIDRNRRIYAISTVTHTRWLGNNGGLLTTRHCVLSRVWRCAFEACAFMLKGTRFMPRTVPYTVKTNALKKKRVVVLIRKIILLLISLLSKLIDNVAIYLHTELEHLFNENFNLKDSTHCAIANMICHERYGILPPIPVIIWCYCCMY